MCGQPSVLIQASVYGPSVQVMGGESGVQTEHAADVALRIYERALAATLAHQLAAARLGE